MQLGIIAFWVVLAILAALVVFRGRAKALPPGDSVSALPASGKGPDDSPSAARALAEEADISPSVGAATKTAAAKTAEPPPKALSEGLSRTRGGFIARLDRLVRGRPKVDEDLLDEIEEVLFTADIGAKTAQKLLTAVSDQLDRKEVADPDLVWTAIRSAALDVLEVPSHALKYDVNPGPYVLLMIGVNGVGKTTTLAKLAAQHTAAGRRVLMVAGDTFRAGAAAQLGVWAERINCELHVGQEGADPSSVIFSGIQRGRTEGYDVVLCDTAGRLHTRDELMQELGKISRSAEKALSQGRDPVKPHDVFLVLDATIGQNALAQAQLFKSTVDFSGLVITKLDGTAKGGVVLGVCDEMRVPVRFVGIGEQMGDLRTFDAQAFAEALFQPAS